MTCVSEDDCVLCSKWPAKDRWGLREMIDRMPLRDDEPVCDECQMAFSRNIGFLDLFHGPADEALNIRNAALNPRSPRGFSFPDVLARLVLSGDPLTGLHRITQRLRNALRLTARDECNADLRRD